LRFLLYLNLVNYKVLDIIAKSSKRVYVSIAKIIISISLFTSKILINFLVYSYFYFIFILFSSF